MPSRDNYFFEIHSSLPREGPGSIDSTLQALAAIPALPSHPRIADMGCGPGKAALLLTHKTGGHVSALDLHQPFLDHLAKAARAENCEDRVQTISGDMLTPPFRQDEFDLIWSEGAIYLIGLENGLRTWNPFLKKGGYIAVSHLSWLTASPSKAAHDFWSEAYPAIRTVEENALDFARAGYTLLQSFALPPSAWWDEYYGPMEKRIDALRQKYPGDGEAKSVADSCQSEIDLWKNHGGDYGYVFYIARKN